MNAATILAILVLITATAGIVLLLVLGIEWLMESPTNQYCRNADSLEREAQRLIHVMRK